LPADRHQPSGYAHIDSLALELITGAIGILRKDFWDGMRELELARVTFLSERFDLL